MHVFINYKQGDDLPDRDYAVAIQERLAKDDHSVFRDETGLTPSEQWADRLYDEINKCDALVAIISNASLRSDWCLNEVKYARQLGRRIVPLVIQKIDERLQFTTFNPLFQLIHFARTTGDVASDAEIIAAVLVEESTKNYSALIQQVCQAHGVTDTGEILEALMHALRMSHASAMINENTIVYDGLDGTFDSPSRSIAESVARYAMMKKFMSTENSKNEHIAGRDEDAKRLSWLAQRYSCLLDLIKRSLEAWDIEGADQRELFRRCREAEAKSKDSPPQSG